VNTRDCCPLCSFKKNSIVHILKVDQQFIDFIESYYGEQSYHLISKFLEKDIKYIQCHRCELIYQKNILKDDGMYELYENLIDPVKSLSKRLSLTINQNLRGVFLLFNLIKKIDKPIREITIVDLGMGFGNMLSYCKALGCVKSYGVELSKCRIEYAKENFGVSSFDSLDNFENNSLDIILSNQSLEHISKVRETLDLIEQKLMLGGLVYIAVPDSSKEKIFLKKGAMQPLEHINSFVPKSKSFLFSKKMKYQFMFKNLRPGAGTIWLFKKIRE
jgi:2-polyprenyl-3-methyl-5-hydroxy-6-metoxy-1,4-benzoquinol methylase